MKAGFLHGVLKRLPGNLPLLLIVVLGAALRFYHLDYQSLWLDELHTLIEADPCEPWSHLFFFLRCCEQKPPLFFVVERFAFVLLGHSSWVARLVSALLGVASIIAIHRLGKSLMNRELGWTAALLLAVNYYAIAYSQEARSYSLLLMGSILSYLFFLHLLWHPHWKNALKYAATGVLLMYTHYFGLMLICSQVAYAAIHIFRIERARRGRLLRLFLLAGLVVAVAYLPWIPRFIDMMGYQSKWLATPGYGIVYDFVKDFFGRDQHLMFLVWALLAWFVVQAWLSLGHAVDKEKVRQVLLLLLVWFTGSLLIPYLRSLLGTPMLVNRYAIIVLPALILGAGMGVVLLPSRVLRFIVLAGFVGLSLYHLVFRMQYYSAPRKTQFREMMAFVAENGDYPLVNERVAWHLGYYRERFGLEADLLEGNRRESVDRLLYDPAVEKFWIAGAHGEEPVGDSLRSGIEGLFREDTAAHFYDAWATLYERKKGEAVLMNHANFPASGSYDNHGISELPVWTDTVVSDTLRLKAGTYTLKVRGRGTAAEGAYPRVRLAWNGREVGVFTAPERYTERLFPFRVDSLRHGTIEISLLNDFYDPESGADRNAFIQFILLQRNGR